MELICIRDANQEILFIYVKNSLYYHIINIMAEGEHGFGPEFDNHYNEFVDEMETVRNLEEAYDNDPSPDNLRDLNAARRIAEAKATIAFKDVAVNIGVDPDVMGSIEWDKDLTADEQPNINTSGEIAELGRIIDKLRAKFRDGGVSVAKKLSKVMGENITDKTVLFETETDPSTGRQRVRDDPENQKKARNALENFKKIFGSKIAMVFYLLCVMAGGTVGFWELWKKTIGCDIAKAQSGCFAIDPVNSKLQVVNYNRNVPSDCYSYDDICGGCDKGYVQPGKAEQCCTATVDADADQRKGWNYTLRCVSPAQGMLEALKAIGTALDPSTMLKKLLMILLYVAIAVVGVVVIFYLIKFALSRFKGSSHKESDEE